MDAEKHRNALGVVLHSGSATAKKRTFTTLVLSELNAQSDADVQNEARDDDAGYPRPVVEDRLFQPEGPCGHEMLELTAENISVITTKTLKVAGDKIVDECKKRQIPRFR